MHNVSPDFNNTHPLYYSLVIVALRQAVKRLDPTAEAHLDMLLEQGKIAKKIKYLPWRDHICDGVGTCH